MSDQKCQFVSLDIYHPDTDQLGSILYSINALELVGLYRTARHPHIVASIQTPLGLKQLSSLR